MYPNENITHRQADEILAKYNIQAPYFQRDFVKQVAALIQDLGGNSEAVPLFKHIFNEDVRSGDILVFRGVATYSQDTMRQLSERLKDALGKKVGVLLLPDDMEIEHIEYAERKKLAAYLLGDLKPEDRNEIIVGLQLPPA